MRTAGPNTSASGCTGASSGCGSSGIDLLQLHRIDPKVPVADQIGALTRLQEEGKIRHIGLSEVTVDQIREVQRLTEW